MADSQIVYTEMVAERKTEESIPYGSNKHRGSTEKKHPLACVLRRVMLKGILTPCVRTASDPPCFYCGLPSAWKGRLCPTWVPGLCFTLGYALVTVWVCLLASIQLYTLCVRGIHPSTDPETYPLIIHRSGPRKHSMFSWRSVGYGFFMEPLCVFD